MSITELYNHVDKVISEYTYQFLDIFGWDLRPTVDISKNWYWVDSPTPLVLLLAKYCVIVFTSYFIISMRQRNQKTEHQKTPDPLWLKLFMQFHNVFLAVLSCWMFTATLYYAYTTGYPFWGVSYEPSRDVEIAWVFYIFYLSKFYEFFDTYIMLVKGNLRQVSVLHVYHHISTAVIFWMVTKQAPGGDAYNCIWLNAFVHTVMYSYYFLTTIIKSAENRKRYLWWGQYLTQLQMTQFVINLIHACWCFWFSPYWYIGKVLQLIDMLVLLPFFMNFYIKKYVGGNGNSATGAGKRRAGAVADAAKASKQKSD